jgi:hypothetical protein
MKRILLVLLVLSVSSCRLTQHYSKYIDKNQYGRTHLKEMKFKNTFTKEMSKQIEADAIYVNVYEDTSVNFIGYSYIRFFSSGQYAIFHSKTENADVNDMQRANVVGYYNIKNNILLLEVPNSAFSRAGKRVIVEYEIIDNNTLKEKRKKNQTERVFTKIKVKEIKPIYPDW